MDPNKETRYRLELEQLQAAFPGERILARSQVYAYTGRSRYWCNQHLSLGRSGTTIVSLAQQLAEL